MALLATIALTGLAVTGSALVLQPGSLGDRPAGTDTAPDLAAAAEAAAEAAPPASGGAAASPDAAGAAPADADPTGPGASGTAPRPLAELTAPAWVSATAATTGIPERALAAYAGAALQLAAELPGCGIGWNTLAAVGQVETHHGTIFGGSIGSDGRVLPRIVGLPLDGGRFDAVPDSDGGALDGDTVWDRAVGPLQFIPSTWAFAGADGDLDGRADPDDIDDAALAAARYLCAADRDLTRDDGWLAAIRSYNSSVDYGNRVSAAAEAYAAAVLGASAR
ncbi:MAG: hypothetical protein Q7T55_01790 [Solirubrobacteraceae bacterium]|nr:hypothetical protein [Solirubrobacteraceae bacterium]